MSTRSDGLSDRGFGTDRRARHDTGVARASYRRCGWRHPPDPKVGADLVAHRGPRHGNGGDLPGLVRLLPAPYVQFSIPWPIMAVAVAVAELRVVEVHFRRESHSFSLSEFPAVIGMFFLAPNDYLIAVLVGSAAALILGARQPLLKASFNLANVMLMAVISLTVLHRSAP